MKRMSAESKIYSIDTKNYYELTENYEKSPVESQNKFVETGLFKYNRGLDPVFEHSTPNSHMERILGRQKFRGNNLKLTNIKN